MGARPITVVVADDQRRADDVDASEYVIRALCIGASGFLLEDTPSDRLLDAVRVAAAATR